MHAITYFYRFLFISLSGILWLVPQYCFSRSDAIVTSKSMVKLRQLAIRHSHTLALAVKLDPTNNQPPSKTTIEAAAATTAPRNNHTESVDDARNSFKYHLEVYLRALYLLVLFLPLLLLAPMAYLSPGFREKFWFPLLKTTIAHSGAVSVVLSVCKVLTLILFVNIYICRPSWSGGSGPALGQTCFLDNYANT